MATSSYRETVRYLSQCLIAAQKPIRILNAIKWPLGVARKIQDSGFRDFPRLTSEDYRQTSLDFEPKQKQEEFREIRAAVRRRLGTVDPVALMLVRLAEEYMQVVDLLTARGTPEFGRLSAQLYGSTQDHFFDEHITLGMLGRQLSEILEGVFGKVPTLKDERSLSSGQVVQALNQRLKRYFGEERTYALSSDGILADAAAGSDSIRIREDVFFSPRMLNILEVHEGWVHVGTTLNGRRQTNAQWLSIGSPSYAATQEGLAVFMEILTLHSNPQRARKISDRVVAIEMAEQGAHVLEVFRYFISQIYSEEDALRATERVFRGTSLVGDPFTKDLSYCKGFVHNYNFIRAAVRAGRPELIPFLFVGKVHTDDIPWLYQKYQEGLVLAPYYLPPQFQDLNGLVVWMSFSSFLNRINMERVQMRYNELFEQYL